MKYTIENIYVIVQPVHREATNQGSRGKTWMNVPPIDSGGDRNDVGMLCYPNKRVANAVAREQSTMYDLEAVAIPLVDFLADLEA